MLRLILVFLLPVLFWNLVHAQKRLPQSVQNRPSAGYNVDFLVYEFEVPEVNHQPGQKCPCLLDAGSHFRQSGLERLFRP